MRPPARNTRSTRGSTTDNGNPTITQETLGDSNASQDNSAMPPSKKGVHTSGKTKKSRHRMTNQQLDRLEALYQHSTHPSRQAKQELGDKVGMYVEISHTCQ